MLVLQAFRYELSPTAAQRVALSNHAGAARWAWNWGLAVRRKAWRRRGETLNAMALHRLLVRLKRTPRFAWLYQVSKCAPQEALRDLDQAYANWWRGRSERCRRVGAPRFKKLVRSPDRFRLAGAIRVEDGIVVLPWIGRIRTKEPTGKFDGRILSATCRREADRWYCSLTVEVTRPDPLPVDGPVVGVDLGVRRLAVCSDGTLLDGSKALNRGLRRLRRRARAVSRKRPGSRNRAKAALALARSISDQSWGEFRRQLAYKCGWYGSRLVVAPRFFPSSKSCSGCGFIKDRLPLAEWVFRCEVCGLVIDRDLNAARNLARFADAGRVAGSSPETENACGAGSAGRLSSETVELPATKQERKRIPTPTRTDA